MIYWEQGRNIFSSVALELAEALVSVYKHVASSINNVKNTQENKRF